MLTKQNWLDWLFRMRLYRGTPVEPPPKLVDCLMIFDRANVTRYSTELNDYHEMTAWLKECEGPWTIRMKRPLAKRQIFIVFARKVDAAMFRIMTA